MLRLDKMLFGSRKLAKSRSFSSSETDADGPLGFGASLIGVELQPNKNNESKVASNSDFFIFQISIS
jgi:hypothetical protein